MQQRIVVPAYKGQAEFQRVMKKADELRISDYEAEYGVPPTERQLRMLETTPEALSSIEGSY
ncbi:MAG: hypothetical protein HY094_05345 [Candidatus Melainabacteria bacterium]|nr:hypothetical protein [Candidatus Melainabacteria bacterium]